MDGDADEDAMKVRLDPVTEKNIFFDVTFKRGVQVRFVDEGCRIYINSLVVL